MPARFLWLGPLLFVLACAQAVIPPPGYRFTRALASPRLRLDHTLKGEVDQFSGTVRITDVDRLGAGAFDTLVVFQDGAGETYELRLVVPEAVTFSPQRGSELHIEYTVPGADAERGPGGGLFVTRASDGQALYYLAVRLGPSGDLPFPAAVPGGLTLHPRPDPVYVEALTYESLCQARLWHGSLDVRGERGAHTLAPGQACEIPTSQGSVRVLLIDHVGALGNGCERLDPAHLTAIAVLL